MEEDVVLTAEQEVPLERRPRGFAAFFEAEHLRLYRALYLVTRNTHEAEELMQDAFYKVWEKWTRVRRVENARGHL